MKLSKENFKEFNKYPEKVLQFGSGNFLKAFVDWQIDKMNKTTDFNGSVVVVAPTQRGKVENLNDQDGLFTLYLQGMKNGQAVREYEIINSISRGINSYKHYDELMKIAEQPELRFIVSNTTEAGIVYDENDKFEDKPQNSFPGKLAAFLYHRFKFFNGDKNKGFIIIPCELIDRNGEKLQEIIIKHAENWDLGKDFINWIKEENTFCCSLVDRIVPGFPNENIEEIEKELGYKDELVCVSEQFYLWVIEGPAWIENEFPTEKAGLNVKLVNDMTPYRVRKVRILNGAHSSLAPVAYLYGLNTVGEAVENDIINKFIRNTVFKEIIPTLDLPEDELGKFAEDVLARFANPFVKHHLISITLNSMSKFANRNLPSLLEYIKIKGYLPNNLCFSLAALIEFYKGKRGTENIELKDNKDILDLYKNEWNKYDGTKEGLYNLVSKILSYDENWKLNLNNIDGLTNKVTDYLWKMEKLGIQEAIKEIL